MSEREHPGRAHWAKMLRGELGVPEIAALETHLANCAACCAEVESIERDDAISNRVRQWYGDHETDSSGELLADDPSPGSDAASFPRTSEENFLAGQVPGYEIEAPLGHGGMGEVWLARQIGLNRRVALKTLSHAASRTPELASRFRLEGQALARLQHPNIVRVYDVGAVAAQAYIVMEYCEGGSLAGYLHGRKIPTREAAELVRVLALAVHSAHACGIVHRDLKPENVLLQLRPDFANGTDANEPNKQNESSVLNRYVPKIGDFGLAVWVESDLRLTQSGSLAGSPNYMSPEQALGQTELIGPATDVYSLGTILYELLMGEPPFARLSLLETLTAVREEEPELVRGGRRAIPRDLATICLKCLNKSPLERYQSALQLADELQRFLEDRPILARRPNSVERLWRWSRRNRTVAALAGIVIVLIVAAMLVSVATAWRLHRDGQRLAELATSERSERFKADAARERAELAERQSVERLVSGYLLVGQTSHREQESNSSLFWYMQAWEADSLSTRGDDQHRLRVAMQVERWPKLTGLGITRSAWVRAAWTDDFRRVALVLANGVVELWSPFEGRIVATWRDNSSINACAVSPCREFFVTGDEQGRVRVRSASTGADVADAAHKIDQPIAALAVSSGATTIAIADTTDQVRWWRRGTPPDPATSADSAPVTATGSAGESKSTATGLRAGPAGISDLQMTSDGRTIVARGLGGGCVVWDSVAGRRVFEVEGVEVGEFRRGEYGGPLLSVDGSQFFVARKTALELRRSDSGELDHKWEYPREVRAWSARNALNAVAVYCGGPQVFVEVSVRERRYERKVIALPLGKVTIALSADGRRLATMGASGQLNVWNVADAALDTTAFRAVGICPHLAWHFDGNSVLAIGLDQTIRVWNVPSESDITAESRPDTGPSPNRPRMNRALKTFEGFRSNRPPSELPGAGGASETSQDEMRGAPYGDSYDDGPPDPSDIVLERVSADGSLRLCLTRYDSIHLLDTRSGHHVVPPLHHSSAITSAALSDNRRLIAVVVARRTLRLYDARTGDPIGERRLLQRHTQDLEGLQFTGDDSLEYPGERGEQITVQLPSLPTSRQNVARIVDLLTGQRLDPSSKRVVRMPESVFALAPESYLEPWREWRRIDEAAAARR